jgi:hypothetical protein
MDNAVGRNSADGAVAPHSPASRNSQRWLLLAAVSIWLIFPAGAGFATTILVTDFADTVADDGFCSLAEAITSANTDSASGATAGECPAGSGADRIELQGNVSVTAVDNNFWGDNGLPRVASRITLAGNGYEVKRASAAEFRLFFVNDGAFLRLQDVTLKDGGGVSYVTGGAMRNHGEVFMIRSTIRDSRSQDGAAGILNLGKLTLVRSTVRDGGANSGSAGGIANLSDLTLIESKISTNWGAGGAGGIENGSSGNAKIDRCEISGNIADGYGGGIANSGSLEVTNSTISTNTAEYAGGVFNTTSVTTTLLHTTISGNTASIGGGAGVQNDGGTLTLTNSLIADSSGPNCHGTITDGTGNRADDTTCGTMPGTLTNLDKTASDNGGPTHTHALQTGSTAIGVAGDCSANHGVMVDQRNALRSSTCDSGAYEFGVDDRFEISGSDGHDDSCWGHQIPFGTAEDHLHTNDKDWIWFEPTVGAKYEIETTNLLGSADTVIELWRQCSEMLEEDDDSGEGLASLLVYDAVAQDQGGLSVKIQELGDTNYSIGKGYDVTVKITANPPACTRSHGNEFYFQDEQVLAYRELEACSRIEVSDVSIKTGGEAALRAGDLVVFDGDFQVDRDATFSVEIDPHLK